MPTNGFQDRRADVDSVKYIAIFKPFSVVVYTIYTLRSYKKFLPGIGLNPLLEGVRADVHTVVDPNRREAFGLQKFICPVLSDFEYSLYVLVCQQLISVTYQF